MFDVELAPPAVSEIELTVFGLGFGEAAVVHVGGGLWIMIDSCQRAGKNMSLEYFGAIGVPLESVVAIVATHWDMDHVDGLSDLVESCQNAVLFVPSALDAPAIQQHVMSAHLIEPPDGVRFRRATALYGDALAAVVARHERGGAGMRPTSELTPIFRRLEVEGAASVHVEALSPSSATWNAAAEHVAQLLTQLLTNSAGVDPVKGLHPNDLSIAVWVRAGDRHMLLGADLENQNRFGGSGWQAVVDLGSDREAGPNSFAQIVKVPHHGSSNANSPMLWGTLMTPDPGAVVAPWMTGGRFLPQQDDLVDLADRCRNVWVAADVPIAPVRGEKSPNGKGTPVRSAGFVRLRSGASGPADWKALLGGTAFAFG